MTNELAPQALCEQDLDAAVGGAEVRGNLQIATYYPGAAAGTGLASVTDLVIDPFNPQR